MLAIMSILGAFLMLWGLSLGPATEGAIAFETRPNLWAEAESLLEPRANLTLTCQARLMTPDFELFKDGVTQELVHLDLPAMEHQFPLGAVTSDTRGLYRCRSALNGGWTQLSNLLKVTGAESLPPPLLSTEPVSWITPGLKMKLLCHGGYRGVTFLLRREGDDQFLDVAEAPKDAEATFSVHQPGNYSCSYRTHEAGASSEPSATVTVEELEAPLPPTLSFLGESAGVLPRGAGANLLCVAPLSGVEFQLRRGEEELLVPRSSSNPDSISFHLNAVALGNGGLYTCRYRLRAEQTWSSDSAPAELLLSDETLPAPELSAHPATLRPAPGTLVQLRCRAPRAGLRFALVREDAKRRVHRVLSPAGTEATFELPHVSVVDSANYSCVYVDTAPPFKGSAPSAHLELRVDGPPPRPRLWPLSSGAVVPGHDVVLRCESQVPSVMPRVIFELLKADEEEPSTKLWSSHASADLVLTYVGPQHAGNYSCRYRSWSPKPFVSELSDPVELQVAGS
ncbi:PREDICTED: alpha-1B-glycoprotein [Odobenus rosmarus divergens]|uniref:Alpha-1B-glycoprotein n=1 Tax=Odobenus rosmarus divergens TaxID=9708 RepID=A0A2U3WBF3_ODORO|nr:PREDICTED: alpha-1B-glycoprotein [Odobenus rosmarus divergens]